MNSKPLLEKLPPPVRKPPVLLGVAAVVVVLLLWLLLRPAKSNGASTAYYEVKRGDFTVSVVEGGTLATVKEVSIRSEVEGTARIISIVAEGSYAKKGDLLVELDSAQATDQVNQQQINYEKAKFAVEQAEAQVEIAKSATNSDYIAAELKVKFARIDQDRYLQGQKAVDLIESSNKLVQAQALFLVNSNTYKYSTNLAAKGYETKAKVDGDWLTLLNNQNSVIVASNGISMLKNFDVLKLEEKYASDLMQARQELDRVVSQNKRKMAQYVADLESQRNTLALNESKLARDKKNLAATKIYAPQDGLVVYQVSENRFSSESLIEGGAVVRNRQELIKLPDLSRMKVTVKIHESHVNMIRPGLPAFVVLDSAPDVRYAGVVEKVAPLPDTQARWGNPNLKVYNTDIYITDPLNDAKPGVSAKAEIIVTNIANTLSVPIQAITTYKGKQVAYFVNGSKPDPRPVEAGLFNTKFIEIVSGMKEGDRVLLSPPFDAQEKDLEGAVLAADEKVKVMATNKVRIPAPAAATEPSVPSPENGSGAPQVAGRPGGFNPADMLKQFDKDGDGQLDDTEREAMRAAMTARFGAGGPGGARLSREEALKRFDKNGDGELDETERAAMRAAMGGSRTNRTDRRRDGEAGVPRREATPGGDGQDKPAPQPQGENNAAEPKNR